MCGGGLNKWCNSVLPHIHAPHLQDMLNEVVASAVAGIPLFHRAFLHCQVRGGGSGGGRGVASAMAGIPLFHRAFQHCQVRSEGGRSAAGEARERAGHERGVQVGGQG